MGLFTSRADLESKITSLEKDNSEMSAEIGRLESELTNATADLSAARKVAADAPASDAVEQAAKERDAAIKERDEAKAEITPEKIEAKAVTLLSSAEAPPAVQKIIAARVTEELAKAGHHGPVENADKDVATAKTITRAEFQKLSPHEQGAHFRNGGKITD
jgi:hypothetical protein